MKVLALDLREETVAGPAEPVGQVGPLARPIFGQGLKAKRSKTDEKIWGQPESRRSRRDSVHVMNVTCLAPCQSMH